VKVLEPRAIPDWALAARLLCHNRRMPRWLIGLRWTPLVLGAAHAALFAAVVMARFAHPIELEWMSGGVWDHVERVAAGKPLYVAPGAEFTPFLYPPLHYWLSALLAKAFAIPIAARLVSVLATAVAGACVYLATKRLTQDRHSALLALALFAGAYSVTGYWYDLDRSDSLCVALLTAALATALGAETQRRFAIAGALLGVAFLAKQPAMVFLFVAVGALAFARRFRLAGALLAGGLAVLGPALAWLYASSDGWFWFYCMKMPASHGMSASLITLFFIVDAGKTFALFGACLVAVVLFGRGRERRPTDVLLVAFVAAAFFTSASSRMHKGGWVNGLVFLTTFGAIAFGVLRARAAALKQPVLEAVVSGIAIAQLVHFLYDPSDAMPSARQREAATAFHDRVAGLEHEGEVLALAHAHVGTQRHLHAMALVDVLRTDHRLPADLEKALDERKYAAIVVDEPAGIGLEELTGERTALFDLVARNYAVTERLPDVPPPVIGYPARPTWLLRPRAVPLEPSKIEAQVRAEMADCERIMRTR
jgi:hypothetical protein